jgi:hypothetical protein
VEVVLDRRQPQAVGARRAPIEIALPNGIELRVAGGFDRDDLVAILAALRSC